MLSYLIFSKKQFHHKTFASQKLLHHKNICITKCSLLNKIIFFFFTNVCFSSLFWYHKFSLHLKKMLSYNICVTSVTTVATVTIVTTVTTVTSVTTVATVTQVGSQVSRFQLPSDYLKFTFSKRFPGAPTNQQLSWTNS